MVKSTPARITAAGASRGTHALRFWVRSGFWALIDQGLFGVANFTMNIALARWLHPVEYGAFAVAFGVFLLIGTAHTALLTEPMLVFSNGRYKEAKHRYLLTLVVGHWVFSGAAVGVLILIGLALSLRSQDGATYVALAVAAPLILLLWMLRRACYIVLSHHSAARAGIAYLVLTLTGLWILESNSQLSPVTAVLALSVAAAVSILSLAKRLQVSIFVLKIKSLDIRGTVLTHWQYGSWAVVVGLLSWLPANVYYFALSFTNGYEATAQLRAALVLTLPQAQASAALSNMFLPNFVNARQSGDLDHQLKVSFAIMFVMGLAYALFIGVAGPWLFQILYAGNYTLSPTDAWPVGAIAIPMAITAVVSAAIRSSGRSDLIVRVYGIGSAVSLVGAWLLSPIGVNASVYGMLATHVAIAFTLFIVLRRFSPGATS
jgi:O-antigen/teichoic acid export membrane protein